MFLTKYAELVGYKVYADLKAETRRTYLGFLWWVFEPIMFMSVFYVMFGLILRHGQSGLDYVSFLLIGLVSWQWFQSCLNHGANAILSHGHLMRQVYLPKILFPVILILTDSVKFVFIFTLLLLYLWFSCKFPNPAYWALPIVLGVQLLLIMAFAFFLASVVPFFPDIKFVIGNILQAVFFISGIFMDAKELVPEHLRFYYYLNPMANLIEDYRQILLHGLWPDWDALLVIAFFSMLGIILSAWIIRRFEYLYPKIT